jgi:ABC-type nitrate/sulfonate/bicarbonate transport system substrate-binding protein
MISEARLATITFQLSLLLLTALSLFAFPRLAYSLDEVKIHVSGSSSFNAMVFTIGEQKGYYKENNLTVLPIMASSQAGIQGLLGGSFDASQILGQSSAFILRGAPLRIVMVFDTKPLFWLFGKKGIKTLADLKGGKLVGVSSLGASTDQMTRELLTRNGIDPRRDVVIQGTGTGAVRMAALLSGALDAAIVNPAERVVVKKQGLSELIFYGDQLDTVAGGVSVTEKLMAEKSDYLRRFLRGTLRAFLWLRANQDEAVAMMAKEAKIAKDDSLEIYQATMEVFTKDGTMPVDTQQRIIRFQKNQLKVDKEIPPEQVYDFRIIQSLLREMKK